MTVPMTLTQKTSTKVEEGLEGPGSGRGALGEGVVGLWFSSLLVLIAPRWVARHWVRGTIFRAVCVALLNSFFAVAWLLLVAALVTQCLEVTTPRVVQGKAFSPGTNVAHAAAEVRQWLMTVWKEARALDRVGGIVMAIFLWCGALVVPFFVLLPFGARPGRNVACVKHVARTVLLGTGVVHAWGAGFSLALFLSRRYLTPGNGSALSADQLIAPMMWVISLMGFWTLAAMVRAVRLEYRGAADLPEPPPPHCDECGYSLVVADAAGRCPECGKAVNDSLGAHVRPPTPWESRASVRNVRVIAGQLADLVRRPRQLYFSMPVLSGQAAAQRWLIGSMVVVGLLATLIVPAIGLMHSADFGGAMFAGALAMGLVWAVMAMMMVGIETAGVAMFSRLKGHGVQLGAAAKVTSYASSLMWPWVILGGLQLLLTIYWFDHSLSVHYKLSLRTEQILLAATLAAAHIGGLLHFELTVYRGVRAIQYAVR